MENIKFNLLKTFFQTTFEMSFIKNLFKIRLDKNLLSVLTNNVKSSSFGSINNYCQKMFELLLKHELLFSLRSCFLLTTISF